MGVYIKGMEMPTRCENCLMITTDCDSDYICSVLDKYIPMKWEKIENCYGFYNKETYPKPDWCPLVELPPHGRLIDADECHKYFYDHLDDLHMEIAEIAIEEMPTILEAEGE